MKRYKIVRRLNGEVHHRMLNEKQMLELLSYLGADCFHAIVHEKSYMKYVMENRESPILVVMLIDGFEHCTVNYNGGIDFKTPTLDGFDVNYYRDKNYIAASEDEFLEYAKLAINKTIESIS